MTTSSTPDMIDARKIGIMTEAKLVEWNIPYEYIPAFPITDAKNVEGAQIRDGVHRVIEELAQEYAGQMKHGAIFPPIVLTNYDVLVDGNTRIRAATINKSKTLPAFKAQFPNMVLARAFAAAMNQQGGRRLTRDEAHSAALDLMRFNHTDESIARELGYSRTQINNWRKEREVGERAERTMVADKLEKVKRQDQWKLAGLTMDAPFAAAVELVADVQPSAKDLGALVKAVKGAASEAEQLQVIAEHRGQLVPSGPPPHRPMVPEQMKAARMTLPRLVKLRGSVGLLVEQDDARRGPWIESWRTVRDLADEVLAGHGA